MRRPAPRLARALASLGLLGLGVTGLAAAGLGLGLAFLASEPGNRFLTARARAAGGGAMVAGRFGLEGLQTDVLRSFGVRGLVIEDAAGKEVLAVDSLALDWHPSGLLRGEIQLGSVRADGVRLDLATLPDGNLDLLALFGVPPTDPAAPATPFMGFGVDLEAEAVHLTGASVRMTGPSGAETLSLRGRLASPVRLRGRDLRLGAVELDAAVSAPVALPVRARGSVGLISGALDLDGLAIETQHSELTVDGVVARVETAPALGLEVRGRRVAAADIEVLAGGPVLLQDLELSGRVHGGLDALRFDGRVGAGAAGGVDVQAMAGPASSPMPWSLDARTDGLALDLLVVDIPQPVRLQGRYRVGGVGVDWPAGLDANLAVEGGSQVLWGEPVDDLQVEARVSRGVVQIEALSAQHAVGRVSASGVADIPKERADIEIAASLPELGRLGRFGAPPMRGSARFRGPVQVAWGGASVQLGAQGTVGATGLAVSGVQVEEISGPASLVLDGDRVGLEGSLRIAGVQAEALRIERADLELDVRFDPRSGAAGVVGLAAQDVSVGDGAVRVSQMVGAVSGSAPPGGAPAATADLVVADLLLGPAEVEAEGGPVSAVLAGDTVLVEFDLARRARPFFAGRVRGDLGLQAWVAEDLVLAPLAEKPFEADGPLRFTLADGGFREMEGRLVSEAGDVMVRGDLVPAGSGASGLLLRVEHLDLAAIAEIHDTYRPPVRGLRLLGLQGDLDLALELSGEEEIVADLAVLVDGLSTPPGLGAEVRDLDVQLGVEGGMQRPHLTMRAAHDGDLLVDVRGTVPLEWEDGVPGPACAEPVALDALLAPGELGRLHARLPDVPEIDALGSASVAARGALCDPDVRLVSTWSVPVEAGGDRVRVDLDAVRTGGEIEVWGALEESLARRIVLGGGATTPASATLAAVLAGDPGVDPARPESWVDQLDLRVVPLGVPLTRLVELAGADTMVQGRLQGGLSLSGPLTEPLLAGALLVDGGRVGSVPVSEAQLMVLPAGDAGYRVDGRLGFGRDGTLGDLHIEGEVPLRLSIDADPDTLLDQRGLAIRVDGLGVPLSVLEGVSPDIEEAAGQLTLGGFVSGSLRDPNPNFVVGVRDGLVVHRSLGVRYADMELDLRASGHRIDLSQLRFTTAQRAARQAGRRVLASQQPGTFSAVGGASIGAHGPEDIELDLEAEGLWLSNRPEARFRVDADLQVAGDWPRLSVGGDVEMIEGVLNLDERVFMDSGDLALDPSITIQRAQGEGGGALAAEGSVFDTLALDVHLDLHRGLRLRAAVPMDDSMGREVTALSTVRLDAKLASQDLWVRTKEGGLVVNGQVDLTDGHLTLVGSKFDLAAERDNTLNFISDDYFEPTVDITAQKVTRSYGTVEARVTGTPSAPEVGFENPDYPDETDVMSILLFGKPAAELSDSEGQAGAGMLSAAIGMMARNSLSRALGGGNLRTEIEFDGDSFRVGRPLSDRVFASFEYLTQAEEDEGTFEVTLEWLISRRLYAEVAGGDGGNSADLFWRWRF